MSEDLEIDYHKYAQNVDKVRKQKALNKLADYLARRDHSKRELSQKLGKEFSETEIEWAIEQAEMNNWLVSEQELAEKVAQQLHRKNKGIHYIKRYLSQKGLPTCEYSQELELEKAQKLIEQKYNLEDLSQQDKEKIFRQLRNRGFEDSIIRSIIF